MKCLSVNQQESELFVGGAMDPVTTEPFPSDNELAKRLFSSPSTGEPRHRHASYSPHESPNKRDPLHKEEGGWAHRPQDSAVAASRVTRSKPRVGFCGALIFLALCLAALTLTVRFNSWGLHAVTSEGKRWSFWVRGGYVRVKEGPFG